MKTEPTEALRLIEYSWYALPNATAIDRKDCIKAVNIAFQEGQSNPKIKQLEWCEDVLFADLIVSDGFSLLFYRINIIDNTLYIGDTSQSFNTIDEAKSAAQRDFEKRIKECLE